MLQGRVYNYSHCVGSNAVSGAGFHYPNGLARGEGLQVYVLNQPDELQPVPHVSLVDVGENWHEEEHICDFGDFGDFVNTELELSHFENGEVIRFLVRI